MTQQVPFPLKNFSLWVLLVAVSLILLYFVFIAFVSINVGLSNMQQDGFWMPITAGIIVIIACVCFFLLSFRFIFDRLKEKNSIGL